jgi:hypothetical protein
MITPLSTSGTDAASKRSGITVRLRQWGLFDNLAKTLADKIVQAALAPENTNLPREQNVGSVPFAPGVALIPQAINTARPDGTGRAEPRRWEFDVAQNINVTSNRLIPFEDFESNLAVPNLTFCADASKSKSAS